ncbi:short-chain dehydrogenase/reductase SDR [Paenibacillus algicola]|uniref:Short-chain dehydrogenase/reductase SDR n=1 Tax=Paenibacillus algicola TaxID=2565926 RepID=A0A4V1G3Y7_9BACL|nr:glucose 1-dehydrogenase [Paenibacillus algicola]QCT02834.1 short-chain dehydrogenase/reductase SDR [Paenibacillus algicola]
MKFQQQTVLITGAAQGIGRGLAEAYAAAGAHVYMADVQEKEGEELAQTLRQKGWSATFVPCDVRKEHQIQHFVQAAIQQTGRVDIVINNAGVSRWKSPLELTIEEWDDVLNINVRSSFLLSREAAKHMKSQEQGGAIVNISSTRSLMSEPHSEAYAASKGAIVALTHALAMSLGPQIRVNCVSPGWIETQNYSALRTEDHEQHPAGRVGTPQDIARACFYLTDPDNTFVTGTYMVVDGGMTRKMIYEE